MDRGKDVMDIDRALARALDADDPGPAFAGKVIAAVKTEAGVPPASVSRGGGGAIQWRAVLPIAATIAMLVVGARYQSLETERASRAAQALEQAQARAAHAQLVQALRLTGQQLNVVHRAIERSQE